MEADDDLSRRPESPKKKVRANPSLDSEAQPSECSRSSSNDHRGNEYAELNGDSVAPTRKYAKASVPDSSSERATTSTTRVSESVSEVIQEGEVSSSENSVPPVGRKLHDTYGDADSITKENDDLLICDSASSDTT